jgi:hypothetical protein
VGTEAVVKELLVWEDMFGGRNECGFPKDKTNKSCFYKPGKKRKEKKNKIEIAILLSPPLCSDVPIPIESSPS